MQTKFNFNDSGGSFYFIHIRQLMVVTFKSFDANKVR